MKLEHQLQTRQLPPIAPQSHIMYPNLDFLIAHLISLTGAKLLHKRFYLYS